MRDLNTKLEARGKNWTKAEQQLFQEEIRDRYEAQGHPYYGSSRLWDDGVSRDHYEDR